MKPFPGLLFFAALALLSAAAAADVQSFPLDNGKVVRGRVVEMKPGEYVVVETADGLQVKIPWQHVRSSAPAKPAAPSHAPPARKPPLARAAPAEAPPERWPSGLRLGGSVAVALPWGSVRSGRKVSDGFKALIPFTLDAGWQFGERFYAGVYWSYARGIAGGATQDACADLSCSLYAAAVGVAVEARFPLAPARAAWIGYRAGWSAQETDIVEPFGTAQTAFGGVDLAYIDGGLDFRTSRHVTVGPFAGAGLSTYLYQVDAVDGGGTKRSIDHPVFHGWARLGVRVLFFL